jgi:hypothetical protein
LNWRINRTFLWVSKFTNSNQQKPTSLTLKVNIMLISSAIAKIGHYIS